MKNKIYPGEVRKAILFILFQFLLVSIISAQENIAVRGQITDASTGEPVIGVNIIEYDSQKRIINGTISDVNGYFSLNTTNPDAIIGVSSIGYQKQEFELNSRTRIDVRLVSESTKLDEVMIVAKASGDPLTGVSERNITSSRVKVDMSESISMGAASAGEALQGKVSGVDIMSVSGNPGSGTSIVIRGLGSMGNSQPLIVVDGIKQNVNIGSDFSFASADQEDLGSLVNIAPQDIKSIEVLKDAASTAVWGSEGADGVLLIETFRGRKGKTQFFYNSKFTWNVQPPAIPMLDGDEYIMLQLEEWHNAMGVFDLPPEIAYDKEFYDFYNYSANTNWIEEINRKGFQSDQFFKLQGGGDKTLYYASVSYLDDLGTVLNTDFKRITTRLNLDYNISDKLKFTMQFSYTNSLKGDNFAPSVNNNIRTLAYRKSPNMSIWEHDEDGNLTGEYFTPIETYQGSGITYFNPVAIGNLSVNNIESNVVENQFVLKYNIMPWLRFRETIAFNYTNQKRNVFLPSNAVGAIWISSRKNFAREQNLNVNTLMTRSQLYFVPRISSEHVLSGVLMWETNNYFSESSISANSRGPSVEISDPAANTQLNWMSSGKSENRSLGALGSLNYTMKDRYIAQLNIRADGSSKFGVDQRWGIFPSVSLGWRFSAEDFLSNVPYLSDGKIRLSYGQAGKQPQNSYDRHGIYTTIEPNQYIDNPVIVPIQAQLVNLKWQTVSSWNMGMDISFFNERLNLTGELYNKITSDLLWEDDDKYRVPSTSGYYELMAFNAGKVQNKGWELFLSGTVIQSEPHRLALNFNISRNINTFLEFPENFENEKDVSIGNGDFPRRADEGVPVGSFYGFLYEGVWPSDESVIARDENGLPLTDIVGDPLPLTYKEEYQFKGGDAKYADINSDGKIDILDVVYLGDSNPDFIGSFGFNYSWKRLVLNAMFFYRVGYEIVNEVALTTEGMNSRDNQSKAVLRRWRTPGQDDADMLPRAYMYHPANNLGSNRYVEDGSFVRLNSLSLSYQFDQSIAERLHLRLLQVSVNMRKLLTFTHYSGQDPEISQSGSDPFWFGTDNAKTPPPQAYTFSINVGF